MGPDHERPDPRATVGAMSDGTRPLVGFDTHLEGVRRSSAVFAGAMAGTDPTAPVATCPDWNALDLLTHLGMVHRWATALITGDAEIAADPDALAEQGRTADDRLAWFTQGVQRLLIALDDAPADLEALVFLKEAPTARLFWARRQCHETTIHAADALSAAGLPVLPGELGLTPDLAADGIDELLRGFWQRGRTTHRSPEPYAVAVRPTDAPWCWLVEVGPEGTVSQRLTAAETEAALASTSEARPRHSVSGTAADLYLALWNRGGEVTDDAKIIPRWHAAAIRW